MFVFTQNEMQNSQIQMNCCGANSCIQMANLFAASAALQFRMGSVFYLPTEYRIDTSRMTQNENMLKQCKYGECIESSSSSSH